jgi:hypothetical protein
MLSHRAPVPGHGWGCAVCGLPPDGAVAVLCGPCTDRFAADCALRFACRGYPATDGRIPFDELDPEPFEHDPAKHEEEEGIDDAVRVGIEVIKPRFRALLIEAAAAAAEYPEPVLNAAISAEALLLAAAFHDDLAGFLTAATRAYEATHETDDTAETATRSSDGDDRPFS